MTKTKREPSRLARLKAIEAALVLYIPTHGPGEPAAEAALADTRQAIAEEPARRRAFARARPGYAILRRRS